MKIETTFVVPLLKNALLSYVKTSPRLFVFIVSRLLKGEHFVRSFTEYFEFSLPLFSGISSRGTTRVVSGLLKRRITDKMNKIFCSAGNKSSSSFVLFIYRFARLHVLLCALCDLLFKLAVPSTSNSERKRFAILGRSANLLSYARSKVFPRKHWSDTHRGF